MPDFEANPTTKTTTATTNPATHSEPPPDPGGSTTLLEPEDTSNSNPTQNQRREPLAKIKKLLWKAAWLFSPNPADVARKIKERDSVRRQQHRRRTMT